MLYSPLLSICIPCYRAEQLLPVVLDALMPQADEMRDIVEVVIADDSPDNETERTIIGGSWCDKVRLIQNPQNLGMSPNIVNCLTKHARGEYVWIWSQHCVLSPGALSRIANHLKSFAHIDAFYVNFNCASYPKHWPQSDEQIAHPHVEYVANDQTKSEVVTRWEMLLNLQSAYCTQTYAHILRTQLAKDHWKNRSIGREFTDARDTFAQSCTVAETMFGKPAFYIGEPVFTIYNGAQTWSSLSQRSRVYLSAFPHLVRIYRKLGLRGSQLAEAEKYASAKAGSVFSDMLKSKDEMSWKAVWKYLLRYGRNKNAITTIRQAFTKSNYNAVSRLMDRSSQWLNSAYQYVFFRCRPARWFHRQFERE